MQHLECELRAGLPLTPPERTFLDLAPYCDLTELVAAGDSLVRRTAANPEHLIEAASAAIGGRGARLARESAALVRSGVDSPMESRLRLLLVLAGLPEPLVGHVVNDAGGGWLATLDLSYPERLVGIDYDGRHHLVDARQWRQDIRRRENLEREGWLVRVITAYDVLQGRKRSSAGSPKTSTPAATPASPPDPTPPTRGDWLRPPTPSRGNWLRPPTPSRGNRLAGTTNFHDSRG